MNNQLIEEICRYNGIVSDEEIHEIIAPSAQLSSRSFADVDRIAEVLLLSDRIIVHGDYDADGIMSTSVVAQYLPWVDYYVPERSQGYGVSKTFVESIEDKATVLTVDCGIGSRHEVALAESRGVDFIVTDHHTPIMSLVPENCIVVNPKLNQNEYHGLSGSGVAYLVMKDLYGHNEFALQYATIGTIADMMPVIGPNRTLIRKGLESMKNRPSAPILSLSRRSGVNLRMITEEDIGWKLGPMINACGRMGSANTALDFFVGKHTSAELDKKAERIDSINQERKALTESVTANILGKYQMHGMFAVGMFDDSEGHGMLGLVASRMSELLRSPSVLLSVGEKSVSGSIRAPEWFNCHTFVLAASGILSSGGGHFGAAGFSFAKHRLDEFFKFLLLYDSFLVEPEEKPEQKQSDYKLPILLDRESIESVIDTIEEMRPYGIGFEKPVFLLRGKISGAKLIGSNKNHAKFDIDGIDAVYFGGADKFPMMNGERSVLCVPGINYFAGKERIQLEIKEIL